jgi:sigma-54 specific flagellar transcriptional regulator A
LLFRAAIAEGGAASEPHGALAAARHHLAAAISYRDRVAEALPAAVREAFLAKRAVVALSRDARLLDANVPAAVEPVGAFGAGASAGLHRGDRGGDVQGRGYARGEARKIVGDDPAIRSLLNALRKVGPSETTVLVHGESGTGKELVAEALHEASLRKGGPLVKVNCAALVETLLLSELFGHEKGSFTGAAARRRGRFEAAEGGTLFLDEIGDISPRTQVALLRVLQEKTFERVGGTTPIRANVRVVCATHRNLKAMVARGEFREDLYYRLCGVVLEVPALRQRLGDLGAIAAAILVRIAEERGGDVKKLSRDALAALKSYPWPGNVRELENALRAASLFADGHVLEPEDFSDNVEALRALGSFSPSGVETLPSAAVERASAGGLGAEGMALAAGSIVAARPSIPEPSSSSTPSDVAYAQVRSGTSLHDMKRIIERECISRALSDAGGNITRAASLLGMKRPRLSQLVKQYGLGGGATEDDGVDDSLEMEEEG